MRGLFRIDDTPANQVSYYLVLALLCSLPFNMFYSHLVLAGYCLHTLIHLRKEQLSKLFRPQLLLLQSIFWITAISALYSPNLDAALGDCGKQAVILIIPMFIALNPLGLVKNRQGLLRFFSLVCTAVVVYLYASAFFTIRHYHLPLSVIFSPSFTNHNFSEPLDIHATFFSMQLVPAFVFCMLRCFAPDKSLLKKGAPTEPDNADDFFYKQAAPLELKPIKRSTPAGSPAYRTKKYDFKAPAEPPGDDRFLKAISSCLTPSPQVKKMFYAVCSFILFAGLIQLGSKTILAVLAVTLLAGIPWLVFRGTGRLRFAAFAMLLLGVTAVFILRSGTFRARYIAEFRDDLAWNKTSETTEGRVARWRIVAGLIVKKPIAGYGAGSEIGLLQDAFYQNKLYNSFLFRLNAHNEYLSLWLRSGIAGLLVYLFTLCRGFKTAIKKRDVLFFVFLTTIALVSFSENVFDVDKGTFFYALFFSFFLFSARRDNEPVPVNAKNNAGIKHAAKVSDINKMLV